MSTAVEKHCKMMEPSGLGICERNFGGFVDDVNSGCSALGCDAFLGNMWVPM